MLRIVPRDESDFRDKVRDLVMDFARDEGINWETVDDSKEIECAISMLYMKFWWIKQNVQQSDFDKMNTREERKKWEEEIKDAEEKANN
jgi:hypothetical protein